MRAERRAIMFDSETSTFPNRHDELILEEFGRIQPGAFGPIDAAECWHQGVEPSDGHYDVAFAHGGKWYHFAARNFSDWFDVDAVAHAVSAAMADAGVAESFHRVSTDSQGAYFVLATVKDIQEFSRALRRRGDSRFAAGFLALPAILPTIALRPADVGADREARFLDLACRLAKGQRILVVDTPDGQANRSLVPAIDSMARHYPELSLRLFSFGTDLRDVWRLPIPANVQFVDATLLSPSEQIAALGSQMREVHALVARGQDVVLFLPWLSRLGAPAGGVTQLDLNWFKEFFGTGRNCGTGSLTLLASVPDGLDEPMDRLLIQELGRMANAELWFSPASPTGAPYPPVDFARSCVQREGLLLTADEQAGRNALRAKIRTLATGDGAALAWEKLGLFPSTDEFLKALVVESLVPNSSHSATEPSTSKPSLWRRLFG
jgi:transcription termination factor Rho